MKCGFPSEKLDDLLHKREQRFFAGQYPARWVRNRKTQSRLLSGFEPCASAEHLHFLLFFSEFLILQAYVSESGHLIYFRLGELRG